MARPDIPLPASVTGIEAQIAPERPLFGKKAILTGGSRDIGEATVKALTAQGVEVVFSYHNKDKRANKVLDEVKASGGLAHAFAGDISTHDGRQAFMNQALETLGGNFDFLILNSSGETAELNELASEDLVTQALPNMNQGGVIVRNQSVPGKFEPQIKGIPLMDDLPVYYEVAAHKYKDGQQLRDRIQEFSERRIRYAEVTGPIVDNTSNAKLFDMVVRRNSGGQRTAREMHDIIVHKLGLPEVISMDEFAERIVAILKNPNLQTGYTELFDPKMEDAQTKLEEFYDPPQVYVQTLGRQGADGKTEHGIGRSIVSKDQVKREGEEYLIARLVDRQDVYEGIVAVSPELANGHFSDKSGRGKVLPGHTQFRAMVETVGMGMDEYSADLHPRAVSFESLSFLDRVDATEDETLYVVPQQREDGLYDVDVIRESNNKVTARVIGLEVHLSHQAPTDILLEDQLIEGAAQAAAVLALKEFSDTDDPLFLGVGPTSFEGVDIQAGDGVEYRATTEFMGRKYKGDVEIYSEDRRVSKIQGISARLVRRDVFARGE